MTGIPQAMFVSIRDRKDMFFSRDNQWFLQGYLYFDGDIHSFFIDRKDQFDRLEWSRSIDQTLAIRSVKKEARLWIRQIKKREAFKKSS